MAYNPLKIYLGEFLSIQNLRSIPNHTAVLFTNSKDIYTFWFQLAAYFETKYLYILQTFGPDSGFEKTRIRMRFWSKHLDPHHSLYIDQF